MAKEEAKQAGQETEGTAEDTLRPGEFKSDVLGCRFTIPEHITIRVHQRWVDARAEAFAQGATSNLAVWWHAAVSIIEGNDVNEPVEIEPAKAVADRLRSVIENTVIKTDRGKISVTISLGIAEINSKFA